MDTEEKAARPKLSRLELAEEFDNVSRACKVPGYSRRQFHEIRRTVPTGGAQGLPYRLPAPRTPHPAPRTPHPNRVAAEVADAILAHVIDTVHTAPLPPNRDVC